MSEGVDINDKSCSESEEIHLDPDSEKQAVCFSIRSELKLCPKPYKELSTKGCEGLCFLLFSILYQLFSCICVT